VRQCKGYAIFQAAMKKKALSGEQVQFVSLGGVQSTLTNLVPSYLMSIGKRKGMRKMADPSKKSSWLTEMLDEFTKNACGRSRTESIKQGICVICGGEAKEFKDELSRKEHTISGMCQKCQDKTFG
jgi:hypothetical protein